MCLPSLWEERILAILPTNGSENGERLVHILFVEYHASFRQAASYLMDREADLEVVAQVGSVREGREKLPQVREKGSLRS